MFRKLFVTFEYFKKYWGLILFIMAVSAYFSFAGGAFSSPGNEVGLKQPVAMPHISLWAIWGALWGYVCGCLGCDMLFKKVLKKREPWWNLLKGIPFCIFISVVVGGANGALSGTAPIGMMLGVFFGSIAGLILVLSFNTVNRKS